MTEPTSIGPAGRTVAANIERLRREHHLSFRELSRQLAKAGRPMLPSGLNAITHAKRRVDADDLAAFARIFGVTPATLLLADPTTTETHDHPAARAARILTARITDLLTGGILNDEACKRVDRALRRVQLEIEELQSQGEP